MGEEHVYQNLMSIVTDSLSVEPLSSPPRELVSCPDPLCYLPEEQSGVPIEIDLVSLSLECGGTNQI